MKRHNATPDLKTPPYLSVVGYDEHDGPMLVLTVDADALNVCGQCEHLHVRVFDVAVTPARIRQFATSLRHWADRLDKDGR